MIARIVNAKETTLLITVKDIAIALAD